MDDAKFKAIYNESRNGCNGFYRHWFVKAFQYSDGVQELAECGCYWLLDILATEAPAAMRNAGEVHGIVQVVVSSDRKGVISLSVDDDRPPIWTKSVGWTDMPEGIWQFEIADEGDRFALILISEH